MMRFRVKTRGGVLREQSKGQASLNISLPLCSGATLYIIVFGNMSLHSIYMLLLILYKQSVDLIFFIRMITNFYCYKALSGNTLQQIRGKVCVYFTILDLTFRVRYKDYGLVWSVEIVQHKSEYQKVYIAMRLGKQTLIFLDT